MAYKEIIRKNWRILLQFYINPRHWLFELYTKKKYEWIGFTIGPFSIIYYRGGK